MSNLCCPAWQKDTAFLRQPVPQFEISWRRLGKASLGPMRRCRGGFDLDLNSKVLVWVLILDHQQYRLADKPGWLCRAVSPPPPPSFSLGLAWLAQASQCSPLSGSMNGLLDMDNRTGSSSLADHARASGTSMSPGNMAPEPTGEESETTYLSIKTPSPTYAMTR